MIADEQWPSTWFNRATRGDETWIIYVTDEFVLRILAIISAVMLGFATLVRDRLLPLLSASESSPPAAGSRH